jgi:hypothetical protein
VAHEAMRPSGSEHTSSVDLIQAKPRFTPPPLPHAEPPADVGFTGLWFSILL